MATIQEIFKTALTSVVKDDWGAQTSIGKITGLTPQKIHKFLSGELKNGLEDERRAIAAALGYDYDAFLDLGRRALGLPVAGKAEPAPSPEVAGYLDKARQIIEAGGEKAETLKNMIKIMKE